jgi:hypothetical protein
VVQVVPLLEQELVLVEQGALVEKALTITRITMELVQMVQMVEVEQ